MISCKLILIFNHHLQYDAEITYLESKERDQIQQLDAIRREISKTDQLFRQSSEQLQTLQYVEEENKLVRQQEKTLKSEITLLRSKLANCETELLQCKNKIRLLMDDIQMEQSSLKYEGQRQQFEINLLHEVERIQNEIDMAIHSAESTSKISDSLKNEVSVIETAIAEKKRQLEKLINEMKEVNLQSLTVASTEEIRNLLEGLYIALSHFMLLFISLLNVFQFFLNFSQVHIVQAAHDA